MSCYHKYKMQDSKSVCACSFPHNSSHGNDQIMQHLVQHFVQILCNILNVALSGYSCCNAQHFQHNVAPCLKRDQNCLIFIGVLFGQLLMFSQATSYSKFCIILTWLKAVCDQLLYPHVSIWYTTSDGCQENSYILLNVCYFALLFL